MGARGERTILAGNREIRILFTNRALADAEEMMGKSVFGVARGLAGAQSGIGDLAHLLRAGIQAARRDAGELPSSVSMESVWAILDEAGLTAVTIAVAEAIAAVLAYTPTTNGHRQDADPN